MKRKSKVIFLILIMLSGCSLGNNPAEEPDDKPVADIKEDVKVSFYGIGDVIIYRGMCGYYKPSENYSTNDFTPMFEAIADDVAKADIAYANQETMLTAPTIPCSGYPLFSTPSDLGKVERNLGFDWISHSSNHTLDQGENGVKLTLDFWDQYPEVAVTGIARSEEERNQIAVIERKGIKVAVLSYTFSTNGISIPTGKDYLVNLYATKNSNPNNGQGLENVNVSMIENDLERARKISDTIIVSMHWGTEYSNEVNNEQTALAKYLADQGVLAIIGTHAHVIQPVEYVTGVGGNKTLVAYGLGNSINSQDRTRAMLGGSIGFNIVKSGKTGEITLEDAYYEPLVNHLFYSTVGARLYKLSDYTEELAAQHNINKPGTYTNKETQYPYTKKILVDFVNKIIDSDIIDIKW